MKKILLIAQAILLVQLTFAADDQPDKVGENLDLNAVLNLFEESESVEDFENKLNAENNAINNLDLNEDGYVDYIRVIDYNDGKSHSLTLQVPYSEKEAQDVAVIQIEEQGDENAVLQIVGDEDLYGDNYIVEPGEEKSTTVVNVYHWKPVRHIYAPRYVPWVSPWRFGIYPTWYRPWKPLAWGVYRSHVRRHHVPCRRVTVYRCHRAHAHYHKHRVHSTNFHAHHHKGVKKGHHVTKSSGSPANKTKKKVKTNNTQKKAAGKPTKRPGGTKKSGNRSTRKRG